MQNENKEVFLVVTSKGNSMMRVVIKAYNDYWKAVLHVQKFNKRKSSKDKKLKACVQCLEVSSD